MVEKRTMQWLMLDSSSSVAMVDAMVEVAMVE